MPQSLVSFCGHVATSQWVGDDGVVGHLAEQRVGLPDADRDVGRAAVEAVLGESFGGGSELAGLVEGEA